MRIAILFDGISALGKTPDLLILGTVEAVEAVFAEDGAESVRIPVNPDGRWMERMRKGKFDLAFNLCEGIEGVAEMEPAVIGVLELLGIPYTGSPSWTTSICLRKHVVNGLLDRCGLPAPRWGVVRPGGQLPAVGFPAICKPAAEDASIGIEQGSVVRTTRALGNRLEAMHERWEDVLVQRYVEGREVNVGILGDKVLPVAEIDFGDMPRGMWRIVSYTSKWNTGSDEDLGATPRCPADLPVELTEEVQRIAFAAWKAVGGTGYGRVDMRIDSDGKPWILEVNANPDIAPDAGLARMARVTGLSYGDLVREVCELALARPVEQAAERWALAERLSGVAGTNDIPDLLAASARR
jgi:D-alanine-D-alanine ligase